MHLLNELANSLLNELTRVLSGLLSRILVLFEKSFILTLLLEVKGLDDAVRYDLLKHLSILIISLR
jgi:hypothetical protein